MVIGMNIGCGTADALPRRPPLAPLADAVHAVVTAQPCVLILSGAPFEKAVNDEFIALYQQRFGTGLVMLNAAGEASLSGLTGLIRFAMCSFRPILSPITWLWLCANQRLFGLCEMSRPPFTKFLGVDA